MRVTPLTFNQCNQSVNENEAHIPVNKSIENIYNIFHRDLKFYFMEFIYAS